MSDSCDVGRPLNEDEGWAGRPIRRRRFLARLGAGGLVAASTMFGRAPAASAAGGCGCCNLVYCPPNTSYSSCLSVSHYLWGCQGGGLRCTCCEKKNSSGIYYASAYTCRVP
jgi:hypothetical protein